MFRTIHDIQEDDANRSFDNLTVVLTSFGIHIHVTTFNRRMSSGLRPARGSTTDKGGGGPDARSPPDRVMETVINDRRGFLSCSPPSDCTLGLHSTLS